MTTDECLTLLANAGELSLRRPDAVGVVYNELLNDLGPSERRD